MPSGGSEAARTPTPRRREALRKATHRKSTARRHDADTRRPAAAPDGNQSVILQARVQAPFAEELLTQDARILGLEGASEVVREGLRLLHRRAQEKALIDAYDDFYAGRRAPLPAGLLQADTEE